MDNGMSGGKTGAVYDYGFRIYDSRIAKFLSVDPLTGKYPWYTPYQFAGNSPIANLDLDGLEDINYKKFQKGLFEGTSKLSNAHFSIESRINKNLFNASNWNLKGQLMVMNKGNNIKPSKALKHIFTNPTEYSFDCAEFVQLSYLYAKYTEMGAQQFDQYIENQNEIFTIRNFHSTGIIDKINYVRTEPLQSFLVETNLTDNIVPRVDFAELQEKDLLGKLPIGSRIMLTNIVAPDESPYKNENIIKVGDDLYSGHTLGVKISFEDMKVQFARAVSPMASEDYVKNNLFLSEATEYRLSTK